MTDKQIYELSIYDLACFGVWYFPMDESAEDELTVHPLLEKETCADAQIIVRASYVWNYAVFWAWEYIAALFLSKKFNKKLSWAVV